MKGFDAIGAERKVGRKYANMMKDAFRRQISVLDKRSGKLQRVGSRVRVRNHMLESISIRTINYAFVNFHGVNKVRKEHSFKGNSGNLFTRKAHPFRLNPKIRTLEIPDHIVQGFADEITEIRGDKVLAEASNNFKTKLNQ